MRAGVAWEGQTFPNLSSFSKVKLDLSIGISGLKKQATSPMTGSLVTAKWQRCVITEVSHCFVRAIRLIGQVPGRPPLAFGMACRP